ncbi:MAG: hypothetical protein V1758_15090 [Pseudomonadota bacterium]
MKKAEMGWVIKIVKLPPDMIKDCRNAVSTKGPKTKARIKGGLKPEFSDKKTKNPEGKGDHDLVCAIVHAISAEKAKDKDEDG